MKILKSNFFFLLVLFLISSFILLKNLNSQDYSLDEPQTVVISKSLNYFFIPSAWDGTNFASVVNGKDSRLINGKYIWTWEPWLQYYLAFGEIKTLGINPGDIRFVFTIFGIATITLFYLTSLKLFKSKPVAFILALQLLFLLPFFLYVRQARYYVLDIFFSLGMFYLFIEPSLKKKKDYLLFIFFSVFLFLSNFLVWGTSILAFILKVIKNKNKKLGLILLLEIFLGIIYFLVIKPGGGNPFFYFQGIKTYLIYVAKNFSYLNYFVTPLVLVGASFFIKKYRKIFLIISFWVLLKIFVYSALIIPHGRFLTDLFPLMVLFLGIIYQYLWERKHKITVLILFILLVTSNILYIFPYKGQRLNFFPQDFRYELFGSYPSFMPKLADYLKKDYKKGDLFWSNDLTLSVYLYSGIPSLSTACKEGKIVGPSSVTDINKVKWFIFFRYGYNYPQDLNDIPCLGKKAQDYMKANYQKKVVSFKDTYYINDPDIAIREFPPRKLYNDEIVIYEKK